MAQFDVYPNPIEPDRETYPYVVQLSSNFISGTRARLTAPLSPTAMTAPLKGIHPVVAFEGQTYVMEIMSMLAHDAADLRPQLGQLQGHADDIFSALDFAFHGY